MRRSVLSIIVALSVLACLSACGKDASNEMAELLEEKAGAYSLPAATPAAPVEEDGTEAPAPTAPDYHSLAAEILTAVWDEDMPEAAEISEEEDSISNRMEITLSYPTGDSSIDITFDKETGRLRRLCETGFNGLLKPARYDGPESAARAWYAALPLPQDYTLGSVTDYGEDLLCYEFNKPVTLETGGEPVALLNSNEAVRIMLHTDTGALHLVVAFYWPVFDGHSQKAAISEEKAVEIAKGPNSHAGNETVSSQITLYHPYDAIAVSDCPPERSLDYSFPAWAVEFRETSGMLDCGSVVYVDLYTGEILGRDIW